MLVLVPERRRLLFFPQKSLNQLASEAFEIQQGASASKQATPGFFYRIQNDRITELESGLSQKGT